MKKPKIITWDLETIWDPAEWMTQERAFAMANWPGRTMKGDINSILCFGYQVSGQKPKCISVWDFPKRFKKNLHDDYDLCVAAYDILKDADAIITHNGKRFDLKFFQTRLKKHRLPPLPKILHIDTCAVARSEYFLFSNRLKDLAKFLGVSPKIDTSGKHLWDKVYRGDKAALKAMVTYCVQDVKTTTECALAMKNVIRNWPSFTGGSIHACPSCGSKKVQSRGQMVTKTKVHQRYQCQDCGTWSKRTKEDKELQSI